MRIIREGKLREELHVLSSREIKSTSFITKLVQAKKDRLMDIITTKGYFIERSREETLNDAPLKISEEGIYSIRRVVHGYISLNLKMGDNIANQSVDSLKTAEEWLEVANRIHAKLNWKQAELDNNFKLISVEDWYRKNR